MFGFTSVLLRSYQRQVFALFNLSSVYLYFCFTLSMKRVDAPMSVAKPSVYVTIEDFQDTVGDGLSFQTGQEAYVSTFISKLFFS